MREEEEKAVKKEFANHFGSFGRRMIRQCLLKKGIAISERQISKIMKENELTPKYGRKRIKNLYTKKEVAEKYVQENIYRKMSKAERERQEIWSMDFTEEQINGQKVYSCGIISIRTRRLVGLTVNCANTKESAIETIEAAIKKYGSPDMLLTDRGSQFTSKKFYESMKKNKIKHSMSRQHTPADNVYIETFWKSMKTEIGKVKQFGVEKYIKVVRYYLYYYNHKRLHSGIGYLTPAEYARKVKTVI